ncbi:MAG TPA: AAC(3)-I family aminoglycoside N-acetyltransferase [Candidatus Aquilonibacter sp.]
MWAERVNVYESSEVHMIRRLRPGDIALFRAMLAMFGEAFEQVDVYTDAQPSDAYVETLLASDAFIALAATDGETVIGGIAAYELLKFEQERREIYIYDIAVAESYRRQGVATALIESLRAIAKARGAYVIFVQADPPDAPAVALYTKLGTRQDVLHFDIEP